MQICELLDPARIGCHQETSSKKRTIEILAELLASALPDFTAGEVFDSLINRERLGSTGLGNGVALPHGRVAGLKEPVAALITLVGGVDFDAVDNKPVDILFALLVPEESTDEHLQILARLAAMFSNREFCEKLCGSNDAEQCYRLIDQTESDQSLTA
jgi:PTS system nitrogen regulatory IIA component